LTDRGSHGSAMKLAGRRSDQKIDTRQIDYTGLSAGYDEARFVGPVNVYLERIYTNAILRSVGLHDFDRRILDVGCGTARGLVELARRGFSNLAGLDYTPAMLDLGAQKISNLSHRYRVVLVCGDAFTMPFRNASFDVVMSLNFLHLFRFELQQELLQQMVRVCSPGGLIVVELESLHKGLFVTRYFEQMRRKDRTKFNSFWEVAHLFPTESFGNVRVRGTVLPKAYRLLHHWPIFGEIVERIGFVPPFNWMSSRVVVVGRRL
jgi:ubiquinone/menaquinone biosynthesis C-methylase UbiE